MKIAIIAPSPVPFGIGGAENLWWGLLNEINQNSPHQAELIKLPSPEAGFWDLIASYKQFSQLELGYFDRVITGKYPGWMVNHDYHVCYMLHRLRGLYDTYHFLNLPETFESEHPRVREFQSYMQNTFSKRDALPEFFSRLDMLAADNTIAKEVFNFPTAFSRQIIQYLDGIGLSKNAIYKYTAISRTVSNRKDYFPPSAKVDVIYPPSNLHGFHCANDDYLFTVSRLDGPKRIGLLIESMQHVKSNIQLKIAGTGPDEQRLRNLAAGDSRIEFLGFVNDKDVVDLYANALAVLYVPYDEDYGLVTIEAMMSSKPVLTVTDSGGPTEFVKNRENGFCVSPSAEALADSIDYLCTHRAEAKQMGRVGQKSVSNITWENTVTGLLGMPASTRQNKPIKVRPKKLTVAVTFPIYPPRGGGQSRVFHFYRHLAKWWDIDLVTMTGADESPFEEEIAPGLREIRIPKSQEHEAQERVLSQAADWVPVTDVAMLRLHSLTPDYAKALQDSAANSDVVVACHPYMYKALVDIVPKKTLWYEAQDVEIDIKTGILGNSKIAKELLVELLEAEAYCWQHAKVAYACSYVDIDRLLELYGETAALKIEVPNGVSLEDVPYTELLERRSIKNKIAKTEAKIALFIGSWHGPNLEAIEHIIGFASQMPQVTFLVLGSGGQAFQQHKLPLNVNMVGVVDDEEKSILLSMADIALNPMTSGSGTNLKMLDYFAAGLPVVSTVFGARGLGCQDGKELFCADIVDFPSVITQLLALPNEALQLMIVNARELAIKKFDWEKIATNFKEKIDIIDNAYEK